MSPEEAGAGLLVAVVGPSGAGKDTLIRLAMEGLGRESRIALARRVVTRAADGGSEDHDSLDEASFVEAEAAGAFCLSWRAHGLAYGLPASVALRVGRGDLVLANLSRRSLSEAASRFGRIAVVEISARPDLLVRRIAARGRETESQIGARLSRQAPLVPPPETTALFRIDNSDAPEDAAAILRRHLLSLLADLKPAD
ncbi:phosphonate metabolism protein/1,5-bisphosphokinase (PRPP-forming) PhnN [Aureimonas psammosilenae]|uniref:phosphonate metabolism protein/1,5-bisphosphokinase (PRPP-forming) PhnN n=1 Tax=Aureimonas psammosilenae TaxID=2495496 RepID=UPI001260BCF0|nr:phosphonate metabolism protein/1,5-bisphosphokinase (PRPP-forming) PhnN [Aureimonas psammosilenae]